MPEQVDPAQLRSAALHEIFTHATANAASSDDHGTDDESIAFLLNLNALVVNADFFGHANALRVSAEHPCRMGHGGL